MVNRRCPGNYCKRGQHLSHRKIPEERYAGGLSGSNCVGADSGISPTGAIFSNNKLTCISGTLNITGSKSEGNTISIETNSRVSESPIRLDVLAGADSGSTQVRLLRRGGFHRWIPRRANVAENHGHWIVVSPPDFKSLRGGGAGGDIL